MATDVLGNKWASGDNYGPVLTRTDLLLLQPELELHPLLAGMDRETYEFDIITGRSEMINHATGEQLPFPERKQPATIPRVSEFIILSRTTPWCTIIINPNGVTVENVIGELFLCYREPITPEEEAAIPPRIKEQMRRHQQRHQEISRYDRTPSAVGGDEAFRRRDFLRGHTHFDFLEKMDTYTKSRLGFYMPHCYVLHMQD